MNWSNVRILQWLIKELITRHPSDAAEFYLSFHWFSYLIIFQTFKLGCGYVLKVLACTRRFPGTVLSLLTPPTFKLGGHSPSPRLASRSNPRPGFQNCMQNDITMVLLT